MQPKKFTDKTQTVEQAWIAIRATPTLQYMAGNQLTKKLDTLPKSIKKSMICTFDNVLNNNKAW